MPRDEVDRFCNQVGYTGFGNRGSVHDYFLAQSIGRCRYTNIVAPYYRARHPKTYYNDRTVPMGQRARELIREALAFHKARGLDFSALTADGQGFVYAMNVYYAGPVVNNLRAVFTRAGMTSQEIRTLRGVISSIDRAHLRQRPGKTQPKED